MTRTTNSVRLALLACLVAGALPVYPEAASRRVYREQSRGATPGTQEPPAAQPALQPAASGQAGARSEKAKSIGKRLMCQCGCNQILTECNHVGCSVSTEMLKKLEQRVARNEPDDLMIQSFVQEYGERVLAQPPAKGFSLMAWVIPGVAVLVGLFIVRTLLLRWRLRPAGDVAAPTLSVGATPAPSPELLARVREQAEMETED